MDKAYKNKERDAKIRAKWAKAANKLNENYIKRLKSNGTYLGAAIIAITLLIGTLSVTPTMAGDAIVSKTKEYTKDKASYKVDVSSTDIAVSINKWDKSHSVTVTLQNIGALTTAISNENVKAQSSDYTIEVKPTGYIQEFNEYGGFDYFITLNKKPPPLISAALG